MEHSDYDKAVRKCIGAIGSTKSTQPPLVNDPCTQIAQEYALAHMAKVASEKRYKKAREGLLDVLQPNKLHEGKSILHDTKHVYVQAHVVRGQSRIDTDALWVKLTNVLGEDVAQEIIDACTKQDDNVIRLTVTLKE